MESQCNMFLYFREYFDIICKDMLPYLFQQILMLLQSWPFVLLVMFLCLKRYVVEFITRIHEIHFHEGKIITQNNRQHNGALNADLPKGIDVDFDTSKSKGGKKVSVPDIPDDVFKGVLKEQERIINNALEKSPFHKDEVLLRELASYQIALDYERIFKDIFKSQFDALEKLNSSEGGMTQNEFLPFYEQAKQQSPKAYDGFSFENWFAFFEFNYFFKKKGKKFIATDKSKAFTYYIVVQRRYGIQYKGL